MGSAGQSIAMLCLHRLRLRLGLPALLVLGLCGCATRLDVQSIGTADGSSVYELRGHQLASLQARAETLCPKGHMVLRQWQRAQPADPNAGLPAKGWVWLGDKIAPGEQDQAQLLVQCLPGG